MGRYRAHTQSMVGGLLEADRGGSKDDLHQMFRRFRRGR